MATTPDSTKLRKLVRQQIREKVEALDLPRATAARRLKLSIAQTSRLMNDYDVFSLDRLVDAGRNLGIATHVAFAEARQ